MSKKVIRRKAIPATDAARSGVTPGGAKKVRRMTVSTPPAAAKAAAPSTTKSPIRRTVKRG